jgi:hypothetical protein
VQTPGDRVSDASQLCGHLLAVMLAGRFQHQRDMRLVQPVAEHGLGLAQLTASQLMLPGAACHQFARRPCPGHGRTRKQAFPLTLVELLGHRGEAVDVLEQPGRNDSQHRRALFTRYEVAAGSQERV